MTRIESMQEYLDNFLIDRKSDKWVSIDWLDNEEVSFSITAVPLTDNGYIGQDILGNKDFIFTVMFSAVFDYSEDLEETIGNSTFFEDLEDWIDDNNKNGVFPSLRVDREPEEVLVVQSPYLFQATPDGRKAQYTVLIQLKYKRRN